MTDPQMVNSSADGVDSRRKDHGAGKVTVVVLTLNEEKNLGACLESVVGWAQEIFIVDSHSTDATHEIAASYGAQIVARKFETHAKQWNWALQTLPISSEWVLGLDADQCVTPELAAEIACWVGRPQSAGIAGCYLNRRQVFRGRWIRHGGYYPKYLLKLFRRGQAQVNEGDRVDHHFTVNGPVAKLRFDIIEDNRNEADLTAWIEKHNRYALLQAMQEQEQRSRRAARSAIFGSPDERTIWLKRTWSRLPLYVRPALLFSYRYFIRLGFLDGKQGFIFHFLQSFWYRLLVDIRLDELRAKATDLKANAGAVIDHQAEKPASRQSSLNRTTEIQENIV